MMNFECFFFGIQTLLYGGPISGILSWLIYKAATVTEELEDFTFEFPWGSRVVGILGIFFIVSITMMYATNKI